MQNSSCGSSGRSRPSTIRSCSEMPSARAVSSPSTWTWRTWPVTSFRPGESGLYSFEVTVPVASVAASTHEAAEAIEIGSAVTGLRPVIEIMFGTSHGSAGGSP